MKSFVALAAHFALKCAVSTHAMPPPLHLPPRNPPPTPPKHGVYAQHGCGAAGRLPGLATLHAAAANWLTVAAAPSLLLCLLHLKYSSTPGTKIDRAEDRLHLQHLPA